MMNRLRQVRASASARLDDVHEFCVQHVEALYVIIVLAFAATIWVQHRSPEPEPPAGVHTVTVNGSSTSTWCEHGNLLVLRTGGAWNLFGSDSESLRIVTGGCPTDDYDK